MTSSPYCNPKGSFWVVCRTKCIASIKGQVLFYHADWPNWGRLGAFGVIRVFFLL